MQEFSIGLLGTWQVIQEFPFAARAIGLVSIRCACAFDKGFGANVSGYRIYANAASALIVMIDQVNNPARQGRLKSPVGFQFIRAFPGWGFRVGRSRPPQSCFSRVLFCQNTLRTSACSFFTRFATTASKGG